MEYSEEQKEFEKLYSKILEADEAIKELGIMDLNQSKIIPLIEKTRNYLEIYKTEVPKRLRNKFEKNNEFDCKHLEELLNNAEESIKRLNNKL